MRRFVAEVLVLMLTGGPGALPARADQRVRGQQPERLDREEFLALIQKVRSYIDRSQFDLEALIDELDYDPERIVAFVRDDIAFEAYPGLLRGAAGTLESRAGNSLDQAVLLATLLKDAGYDARICRGRLSTRQAAALIARMRRASDYPPAADFDAIGEILRDDELSRPPETGEEDLGWQPPTREEIDRAAGLLRSALEAKGVSLGDSTASERLLEEARDYYWVEMRPGAVEWVPVHPVLPVEHGDFGDVPADEIYTEEIPTDLQHRLRVEAFIEQKVAERLIVHSIMEPWERPVANLLDRSITFLNVPWGIDRETLRTPWPWRRAAEQAPMFLPFLGDRPPPGARGFDRNGVPFSVEAMGMDGFGAMALVKEVADKFEKASGLMSGLGSKPSKLPPEDLMALTAEWVEYTLIAPNGEERHFRRMLFDRLGPAARAVGDASVLGPANGYEELLVQQTFHVGTGRVPPALLLDEMLAELESVVESEPLSSGEAAGEQSATVLPTFAPPETFLFAVFDRWNRNEQRVSYRSGPGLVIRQSGVVPNADGVYLHGDIVRSPLRAWKLVDGSPRPDPDSVMRQGVWETATESYLATLAGAVETTEDDGSPPPPQKARTPTLVLRPTDPVSRLPEGFDANAISILGQTLSDGYVAVVDADPVLGHLNPEVAWWRVDPSSGETLGLGLDGRGPVTEWIILGGIGVVLGSALACYASACDQYYKCLNAHDPHCCMARFTAERRKELQKSLPGSLLVKMAEADLALAGARYYDPRCMFDTSPPPPPPTRSHGNR